MGKSETVIRVISADLTLFGSRHITLIKVGFTKPPPWEMMDKNESLLVIYDNNKNCFSLSEVLNEMNHWHYNQK